MSPALSRLIALLPLASLGVLLSGCPNVPADPLPPPQGTIDLALALGVADPQVIGVTVDPDNGARYLLDRAAGLFELADDGTATLLRGIETFPTPAVLPRSDWTDFVSLGHDQFAITALSDGYLLDLEADTLTEYFCYVPDDMGGPDGGQPVLDQLTNSVTFDPNSNILYAQPITFAADTSATVVSQAASIGAYSLDGGQPIAWFDLEDIDFLAGGSAVLADGTLLLGRGSEILKFDPETQSGLISVGVLPPREGRTAVQRKQPSIDGLAIDSTRGELLIVEGTTDELIRISLSDL